MHASDAVADKLRLVGSVTGYCRKLAKDGSESHWPWSGLKPCEAGYGPNYSEVKRKFEA